jgi:hypothetical protein
VWDGPSLFVLTSCLWRLSPQFNLIQNNGTLMSNSARTTNPRWCTSEHQHKRFECAPLYNQPRRGFERAHSSDPRAVRAREATADHGGPSQPYELSGKTGIICSLATCSLIASSAGAVWKRLAASNTLGSSRMSPTVFKKTASLPSTQCTAWSMSS